MNDNERIFELNEQGFTSGKIAQKLKIKKKEVESVLGEAANKGLGDTIERITEATGIKNVVETIADALDADCGCKARKETLNKIFPNRKMNNLSLHDYDYLDNFFSQPHSTVSSPVQVVLVEIYNSVFNAKRKFTTCSPCLAGLVRELKSIYDAATND